MTSPDRPVPVPVMNLTLQMGAALGLARAELLEEIGITEVELADLDGSVTLEQQIRLGQAIIRARPELKPSLVRLVQAIQHSQAQTHRLDDYGAWVRSLLLEQLPRGMTTKDEAARHLGVSPRTLTRRLAEAGVSFREVLEDVRQQLARAWLSDRSVAIHEVAYLLGYSEPSTFHRSFRRWTGQTPAAWRRAGTSGA